jgi:ADP-ribosylglycohydrolase
MGVRRPKGDAGVKRFRATARRASRAQLDQRVQGALVGTFAGDALGMPFERWRPDQIPAGRLEMEDSRLGRGTYTDDTEMTIALAESLLRHDEIDSDDLARTFCALFDPRRGYGEGPIRLIRAWRRGEPVRTAAGALFGGTGSFGNGAAMRVAPVSARFFEDEAALRVQARRSAEVTHTHPLGIDGAVTQAAAIAASLRGEDIERASARAAETPEMRGRLELLRTAGEIAASDVDLLAPEDGVSSSALESVPVAIACAARAHDFEEAVTMAIRCGGDTDTLGAMSGAIAGARFGADAIPRSWIAELEDGERGLRHVEVLAAALARGSGRSCSSSS